MNERDKEIVMEFYGSAGTEQELKLAAFIRADERERIKKANAPEIEKINAHIKLFEATVADEREACAKACEDAWTRHQCASAIRARGRDAA